MSGKHIVFSPGLILSYLILVPGVQPATSQTYFRAEVPGPGGGPNAEEAKGPSETYPYEIPKWYGKLGKKLETPLSAGVPIPTNVEIVVQHLSKLMGVSIRIDAGKEAAQKEVQLDPLVDIPLKNLLRLIAKQVKLEIRLAPGQVVLTDKPEKYKLHELVDLRERMERLRRSGGEAKRVAKAVAAEKAALEALRGKLKSFRVDSMRFSRTPLVDVVETVRTISGVNILIDPGLHGDDIQVDGGFKSISLLEMFEKIVEDAALSYTLEEKTIVLRSKEIVEKEQREQTEARKKRAKRRKELRNTRIDRELKEKSLRELVDSLDEILKIPVYPGPRVWKSNPRVPGPTEGKSIGDLQTAFGKIGVDIIIETDAVFLLKRI